jgi:hypothetical protein
MSWSQRTTEIENRPAQILIDERFRSSAPVGELSRLCWFGVYCRRDPGGSFWHPDETSSLDEVERDLIRLCEQFGRGWAVYFMRVDTRGIREYYIYAGTSAGIEAVLPSLKAAHPDYRIEFAETPDASWTRYQTFLPRMEAADKKASASFFGRMFGRK